MARGQLELWEGNTAVREQQFRQWQRRLDFVGWSETIRMKGVIWRSPALPSGTLHVGSSFPFLESSSVFEHSFGSCDVYPGLSSFTVDEFPGITVNRNYFCNSIEKSWRMGPAEGCWTLCFQRGDI